METTTENTTEPATEQPAAPPDMTAENEQLRGRLREMTASQMLTDALENAGTAACGLVAKALLGEVQYDDAGTPQNIAALVAKARNEFPAVFRTTRPDGIDAGNQAPPPRRVTREMLKQMPAAEIAKLDWDDVRSALSAK
jgi:hypothetical protein